MAESIAGGAGMSEKIHRVFPDGKWRAFPYRPKSKRINVNSEAATSLFSLLPEWAGEWEDFGPWLRESSGYLPTELPDLPVKTVCTAVGKAAQRERERRVSRGLMPVAAYGTSVSTFVSVPLAVPHGFAQPPSEAGRAVLPLGKPPASIDVVESAIKLTDLRRAILVAMLAMGALDNKETVRKDDIHAALQFRGNKVGKSFVSHRNALKGAGFIDSQRNKPYGYWLTPKGKEAAEYLCEKDHQLITFRVNLEKKWQQGDLPVRRRSI